jgi:hypothetical protein
MGMGSVTGADDALLGEHSWAANVRNGKQVALPDCFYTCSLSTAAFFHALRPAGPPLL